MIPMSRDFNLFILISILYNNEGTRQDATFLELRNLPNPATATIPIPLWLGIRSLKHREY